MTATAEIQGCLSILLPFLRPKAQSADETLPYRLRDDFLSPAELSFFQVLSSVLDARFAVQSKVRLADLFFVSRPNKHIAYFNKIAQRHVDFLICDAVIMKPLFGIELDDATHQQKSRQERDEFVEKVFQAAGLPLLRFSVQREYNPRDIATHIEPLLKDKVGSSDVAQSASVMDTSNPEVASNVVPICPKCGIPMVLRTGTRGDYKDKQFYGCADYPRCREIKPISVAREGR